MLVHLRDASQNPHPSRNLAQGGDFFHLAPTDPPLFVLVATQGERARAKPTGWLSKQPEMCMRRAPGNTCLSAMAAGGTGAIGQPINHSKGCGGAMRTAPIGLFSNLFGIEDAFDFGARAAALTHGHPSGYLSAGMVAGIIRILIGGDDLVGATRKISKVLTKWTGHEETSRTVAHALDLSARHSSDHASAVHSIGEGWVGDEAVAIALYAALSGADYIDVIRIAANHDGDSDSTASIAGQFWGAWKGLEGIPHDWIIRLDVLLPALHLVRQTGFTAYRPARHDGT